MHSSNPVGTDISASIEFSATGSGSLPASGGYGLSAEAQLHRYALVRNIQGGIQVRFCTQRAFRKLDWNFTDLLSAILRSTRIARRLNSIGALSTNHSATALAASEELLPSGSFHLCFGVPFDRVFDPGVQTKLPHAYCIPERRCPCLSR